MFKNLKKIKLGLREFSILIILIAIFGIACYYLRDYFTILTDKTRLEEWLTSFGPWSYVAFIIAQIIQVVIFVIPGEVVHIAGGYLFGSPIATMLSIIGITLGSAICFIVARVVGQPIVELFMPPKDVSEMKRKIGNKKVAVSLFIVFIIPGLPGKDAFAYVAGLTHIKFVQFFMITLIARFPWVFAASLWGSSLEKGNYSLLFIISAISIVLFFVGIFKGEQILSKISREKTETEPDN